MDIVLSYAEYGTGSPLFLLHGNGEDRSYFDAQVSAFSSQHHVYAVDTRGHGQSPRGIAPFSLSQFADDLHALMDHLNINQANILGFSDGGNIALLFAIRYPERVKRLMINGANLYPAGMNFIPWITIDLLFIRACFATLFSSRLVHRRELLGLMATQPHIHPKALRSLCIPTLVIAGTKDLIRERHTRLIARSIPESKLLFLEGGHCIAQENTSGFNQAILSFLAEK